jgi:hypothetical protein
MNCGNLHLDIDSYEGFVDVENDEPIDASGEFDDSDLNFSPGEPSEIVMARGFYQWEIITPYFDVFLANVGSRDHLLSSTILFRNEPYETETEDVV